MPRLKTFLSSSPHSANTHFVAHGVGVIGHEAPRLSDRGPVTYPAYDANLPLQAGMVLSIETTLMHPRRGFIKLEDTVAVTETGWTPSATKAAAGTAVCPQPEESEMLDRSFSSRPTPC